MNNSLIKSNSEIKSVLEEFSRKGVTYAIIRNYEFLLQNRIYDGKDIDVLVLSRDIKKISSIMKNHSFGKVLMNPFSMHKGFAKYISEDEKLVQFHFHIDGITGRHVRYLKAKDLLGRRIKKGFFYCLSPDCEFVAVLLHNLLDLDRINDKYKKELENLEKFDLHYSCINERLQKIMPKKKAEKLLVLLLKNNYLEIEKMMPSIKRGFEIRNIHKIPFVFAGGAVWKLFSFRLAPLISLIGMDGAGKTTTTTELKEIFDKNKIKYEIIYTGRGRNNILPIQFFGKIYRKAESKIESSKKPKNNENQTKMKEASVWKRIIYTLAAPVFALDLLTRYFVQILPKRFTKQVVITDRYATDMLLMANVPDFARKMLYFLFPKPTLTIYLWNKAEILHKRKPEHPFDDLKRQEAIFHKISKKIDSIPVKSEGIENAVKNISSKVFSRIFN